MMGPAVCELLAAYLADALIPSKGAENRALRKAAWLILGLVPGGHSHARVVPAIQSMRDALNSALIDPSNPHPGDEEATAVLLLTKKDTGP